MKLSLLKKIILGALAIFVMTFAAVPALSASEPRDYNSNSIIYGGAYSVGELRGLLNTGVNRNNCRSNYSCPYQYADDLQLLYGRLGMGPQYWDSNLKDGTVFKDGHVEVNGRTVATNVVTMGRHYMSGSVREPLITYANVYWRSPSVSFNSNSIPAFVYVNYDGTMAFAIIKSCGNPVKGVGVRQVPTYNLTIRKFEDRNQNKTKEANEPFLPGWTFNVSGNGVNRNVTTGSDGSVTITGLRSGIYSVRESAVAGWTCTTGADRGAWLNNKSGEVWFGNYKIPNVPVEPHATYTIVARKYEDIDGDTVKDTNESYLSGWNIRLTGNNLDREFTTDADGEVTFTNLEEGTYTIREVMQSGWHNTTPISRTITVPLTTGGTPIVEFGNQKDKPIEPHFEPEPEPEGKGNLPVSGPVDAIAGTFGILGLGGAGSYYLKGKKALLNALKRLK